MTDASSQSLEDVLDAFSVEPSPDQVLEQYQQQYPDFAEELAELAQELRRDVPVDDEPLSAADVALMEKAWSRYVAAGPRLAADPFANILGPQFREISNALRVPKQVLTAIRDRKVILESIPKRFLAQLAGELQTSLDDLRESLRGGGTLATGASYKANTKPVGGEAMTFERILTDAGVGDEERARLLSECE